MDLPHTDVDFDILSFPSSSSSSSSSSSLDRYKYDNGRNGGESGEGGEDSEDSEDSEGGEDSENSESDCLADSIIVTADREIVQMSRNMLAVREPPAREVRDNSTQTEDEYKDEKRQSSVAATSAPPPTRRITFQRGDKRMLYHLTKNAMVVFLLCCVVLCEARYVSTLYTSVYLDEKKEKEEQEEQEGTAKTKPFFVFSHRMSSSYKTFMYAIVRFCFSRFRPDNIDSID